MDPEQYRQRSYEIWEAMAPGWLAQRPYMWDATRRVGDWLVTKLAPEPGQTILELAAGIGDTGFTAAGLIGEDGRLISTDFSPAMVEAARGRGFELGLRNVKHQVMDAEKMDLETDSVDGVLCRWGYMLMADPEAAFAETRRVLRDGGRLCFAVWATPERNLWSSIPGGTAVELGHLPAPAPGDPGIFSLGDRDRVRELLVGAGFREPEIAELDVVFSFEDFDQYWRFITELAGQLAMTLRELSDTDREAFRELVGERVGGFAENGGLRMPGVTLGVATS